MDIYYLLLWTNTPGMQNVSRGIQGILWSAVYLLFLRWEGNDQLRIGLQTGCCKQEIEQPSKYNCQSTWK